MSGDLTPSDFLYPTAFLYFVAGVYALYYLATRPFGFYASLAAFADSRYQTVAPFFYLSRGLSAVAGTLTIWWVFSVCRRAFDETVAIVAAFFMAVAFLHVRDSHFGTLDVTMTALIVVTVLALVVWQERPKPWRLALAGLAGGLATSTKYNGLGVWAPFVVAVAVRALDIQDTKSEVGKSEVRSLVVAFAIFALMFAVGFFGGSPYILVRWRDFMAALREQGATLAQGRGIVMSRGWWQHAVVTLPAALGWPLFVASVAGIVMAFVRRQRLVLTVVAFPIAYYVVAGSGYRVYTRDMIPELPFLCMTAAWAVVSAIRALNRARPELVPALTAIAAIAIAAPSIRNDILLDRILRRTDNRLVVARLLPTIIPAGSTIYESGGDYGRVPLEFSGSFAVNEVGFDEGTGQFVPPGRLPDWIILQRSPLVVYSHVPQNLLPIVRDRYELVSGFPSGTDDPSRVYDQQDALFLPLAGLDGIERIGPSFEIYRRRESSR